MSLFLVEVQERITHFVTVLADTEQEAREKVLTFDCVEAEMLEPVYLCRNARLLEGDCEGGKNGREN